MNKPGFIFFGILMIVVLIFGMMGCQTSTTTPVTSTTTNTKVIETTPTVSATTSATKPLATTAATRVITDMYGRQVTIPTTINKVLCTGPIEMEMVYLLAPDKLGGLAFTFNGNPPLVQDKYAKLPVVGGWFGTTTGNYETFIAAKPDIILEGTQTTIEERQQKFGNIPVVGVNLKDYVTGYEDEINFLGELLNVQSQADSLIAYYKDALSYVNGIVSAIPDNQKVKIYYAEGKDGLSTDPTGSMHTRLLQVCGGVNVAQVQLVQGMGQAAASMEQIMLWDPDMIIIGRSTQATLYNSIMSDAQWGQLRAVKDKNVFVRPQNPYSWFDGPPGVCQIVGLYWMVNTLYPQQTKDLNLNAKVKEFYSKFMHYELTDQQVTQLINNQI